jgi:hypothetical protein
MVDLTPIKIVSQEVKPGVTEQRVEAVFHISEEPKHEWKVFFSALALGRSRADSHN